MVIDCFSYNGEWQVLKIHLGVMGNYVDKFLIVEANKTFTGNDKPLYFFRDQRHFKEWWPKIEYYVVNEWDDPSLWQMALQSPQTQGAEHWKREFYIKESIHKALVKADVQDEDTVFIGDVDEIVDPLADFRSETPVKARLRVYAYWLNNRSNEEFWGTLIAQYKDIKGQCLNHLRGNKRLYSKGYPIGWHFTNMGGEDAVRRKLESSYTAESYYTDDVKHSLTKRIEDNVDYLGRDFTFTLDESEWPLYLKENRDEFKYLIK